MCVCERENPDAKRSPPPMRETHTLPITAARRKGSPLAEKLKYVSVNLGTVTMVAFVFSEQTQRYSLSFVTVRSSYIPPQTQIFVNWNSLEFPRSPTWMLQSMSTSLGPKLKHAMVSMGQRQAYTAK